MPVGLSGEQVLRQGSSGKGFWGRTKGEGSWCGHGSHPTQADLTKARHSLEEMSRPAHPPPASVMAVAAWESVGPQQIHKDCELAGKWFGSMREPPGTPC